MSEDTSLAPLTADITSLFEEERARPGLPTGARERLRTRIDLLGPIGGLGGDGGGGSDGGSGGAGAAGGSAGAAGAAVSGGALKGVIASKIAIAAVAFGIGGASGAAVHATLAPVAPAVSLQTTAPLAVSGAPANPNVVASFMPPASASSALSVDDLPNVAASSKASASASASAKATPSATEPSKDTLKQERASLEVARTAITRGDYGSAIAALDRHAGTFPRGQLAEERELMRIQALAGQGRGPEAKARAAQFHRDFPQSLMKGAVDATLRSIP